MLSMFVVYSIFVRKEITFLCVLEQICTPFSSYFLLNEQIDLFFDTLCCTQSPNRYTMDLTDRRYMYG